MPQMSQVLEGVCNWHADCRMSTRAVARGLNVNFSTICRFREFGSTFNRPHNRRPRLRDRVGERFADVNVVNRVPHGGGGIILWSAYSPDMLPMFEMLWIDMFDCVFQFPPTSSKFTQPLRSGTTFRRPQSTAWSTPCGGEVLRCMRQMVVTPDTDWFSDPRSYLFY